MKAAEAFLELAATQASEAGVGIKLRAYAGPHPQNSEIAGLHKGLILVSGKRELIEEGIGFGAVVAEYEDEYYYSQTAAIASKSKSSISKTFEIDSVSRMGFRQPARYNGRAFQKVYSSLAGAYQRFSLVQKLSSPLIEMRLGMGVKVHYEKAVRKGDAAFSYDWQPPNLKVNVDLSGIERRKLRRVMIMNEQGGSVFTRYADSDGNVLEGTEVGAWMAVTASRATFSTATRGVSFSVDQIPGTELRAGREKIGSEICWSGFTYILPPYIDRFSYSLKVEG